MATPALQLLDGGLVGGVGVGDRDVRAHVGQRVGDGRAETAGTAGDEGDPAMESRWHACSFRRGNLDCVVHNTVMDRPVNNYNSCHTPSPHQLFLRALRSYTESSHGYLREMLDSAPRVLTPCGRW